MDEALESFNSKISVSSDDELNAMLSQGFDAYKKYQLDMITSELKKRHPEQYVEEPEELGMKWFNFWTYVRLPLGFLLDAIAIVLYLPKRELSTILQASILLVLLPLIFYGLHKHRFWGWLLNWTLFIFGIISEVVNVFKINGSNSGVYRGMNIAGVITLILIWYIPNYIYFMKRRYLFK